MTLEQRSPLGQSGKLLSNPKACPAADTLRADTLKAGCQSQRHEAPHQAEVPLPDLSSIFLPSLCLAQAEVEDLKDSCRDTK